MYVCSLRRMTCSGLTQAGEICGDLDNGAKIANISIGSGLSTVYISDRVRFVPLRRKERDSMYMGNGKK